MELRDGQEGAGSAGQDEGASAAGASAGEASSAPTHVKRGARVVATQATADGETRNGAPVKAGQWVIEHGNDVQEVASSEAFDQTYEQL